MRLLSPADFFSWPWL